MAMGCDAHEPSDPEMQRERQGRVVLPASGAIPMGMEIRRLRNVLCLRQLKLQ